MVRIRLTRTGRTHLHQFRVIACDSRSPRDGKALEILGQYYPHEETFEKKFQVNEDRVRHWLRNGAQPSDNVWAMLRKIGINKANARS